MFKELSKLVKIINLNKPTNIRSLPGTINPPKIACSSRTTNPEVKEKNREVCLPANQYP